MSTRLNSIDSWRNEEWKARVKWVIIFREAARESKESLVRMGCTLVKVSRVERGRTRGRRAINHSIQECQVRLCHVTKQIRFLLFTAFRNRPFSSFVPIKVLRRFPEYLPNYLYTWEYQFCCTCLPKFLSFFMSLLMRDLRENALKGEN